jgi:hypothetical protein
MPPTIAGSEQNPKRALSLYAGLEAAVNGSAPRKVVANITN